MSKFTPGNQRAAKLDGEDVMELRRRYAAGESQASLARDFGIHINTVGRIVRGESRQRVPMPYIAAKERRLTEEEQRSLDILAKLSKDLSPKIALEEELSQFADPQGGKAFGAEGDHDSAED